MRIGSMIPSLFRSGIIVSYFRGGGSAAIEHQLEHSRQGIFARHIVLLPANQGGDSFQPIHAKTRFGSAPVLRC